MTLVDRAGNRVYRQARARARFLRRDVTGIGTAQRRKLAREWRGSGRPSTWRKGSIEEAHARRAAWEEQQRATEATA